MDISIIHENILYRNLFHMPFNINSLSFFLCKRLILCYICVAKVMQLKYFHITGEPVFELTHLCPELFHRGFYLILCLLQRGLCKDLFFFCLKGRVTKRGKTYRESHLPFIQSFNTAGAELI